MLVPHELHRQFTKNLDEKNVHLSQERQKNIDLFEQFIKIKILHVKLKNYSGHEKNNRSTHNKFNNQGCVDNNGCIIYI